MECTINKVMGVVVVEPVGRLDFDSAKQFEDQLVAEITSAAVAGAGVAIDCSALGYVSSAGLRAFLVAARTAKSEATKLAVCGLSAGVQDVFEMSGFGRIITILSDRDAVLAEMGAS